MNENQKRVVEAMQQVFENFRKKHGIADAGKKAAGTKTKKRRQ